MISTSQAAQGRWVGILKALGIAEEYLQDKHGPCPVCGGVDRWRFDDKDGKGTYFCSGKCGPGDGMRLAMNFTGLNFKECAARIDGLIGNIEIQPIQQKPKKDPSIRLNKIREGLLPILADSPVEKYLKSRGLQTNEFLRYHPHIEYWDKVDNKPVSRGFFPAMVGLILTPDGKPASYHITYLNAAGKKANVKAPKKVITPKMELPGCAIRLSQITEHIGIAEGIETALAVTRNYKTPCWAACNSKLLESFEPPEGVKRVSIFADNDAGFEGQRAGYALANRLVSHGIGAEVFLPPQKGQDFADLIKPEVAA